MDLLDLYSKPKEYKFTPKEIKFIKKHLPKHSFRVKYALYNKKSSKGLQIAFIIDTMPYQSRKSGVENYWTYICDRPITNIEYDELIENYGMNNRRFKVWYYKHIEMLILEDKKYNVETPADFIKICKDKGYTGDFQLKMEL